MIAVTEKKKINLALQGGGAHGAYTWGVLDRLLEEEKVLIEAISGTSAGAMNAAMLVNGYMQGGNIGAKEMLEKFWWRISDAAVYSPLHKNPLERILTGWNMDLSPSYHFFDFLSRVFSPYELNPFDYNPMRNIIAEMLDPQALQSCSMIKLFIAATHVGSGQARVFHCDEITVDVLMASACIPFLFRAVEIEGEDYWDGGYMGNPAIWPLIYHAESEDVVLVQINPLHRAGTPDTASEIINRVNEITFNSSLTAEMRAIDFVSRLIERGKLSRDEYKDMRMHLIYSADEMQHLNASSKMNADWDFFRHLHVIGYNAANEWLRENWKDVGKKSTLDIRNKFLRTPHSEKSMDLINEENPSLMEALCKKTDANKQKRAKKNE